MSSLFAKAANEPVVLSLPMDGRSAPMPWLSRLAFAGCTDHDSDEVRRQKAVLTITSLAKCSVCPMWYGAYYAVGAPLAALGPIVYQVLTILNVLVFFRRKDFSTFRNVQTAAILLAPWWMHLALGGYRHSAALLLWPLLAPLTALLFHGSRQSLYWLSAYFGILALSGAADPWLPVPATIGPRMNLVFFCMNLMMPSFIAYLAVRYYARLVEREKQVQERLNAEIVTLNRRLAAENVRLGAELDVTRRLQAMVLPKPAELAKVPLLDIAGCMRPAEQVGGDYYDVLHIGSRIKIGIGDVTGHGLEAGLVMLMVQSIARTLHEAGEYDPLRFLRVLNQAVYKNVQRIQSDKSLSLSFIDVHSDRIVLSGQHEDVLLFRADRTVERIDTSELGFAIGMEEDVSAFLATRELGFGSGDCVVLHTDGVTEAANAAGEIYGIDRLCRVVQSMRHGSSAEIQAAVLDDLMSYIGSARIRDDISLVVIRHP
ncbi:MAG TPA: PP2C family protein-serine/threonine phosphatase [Pseudomonadota bacterium]|nr:PP2C family protein-serine/threonine phosphatase [Pseudomonadota bacterium]